MKEALLYKKLENNNVRCNLCGHHCVITDGKKGVCQVRENRNGVLYTLVIPGLNDDSAELRDAAQFVAQELGVDTPWHISRFFPAYKMTDVPPTPLATLQRARQIGLEEGLNYVYVGNIPDDNGQNTYCPGCGRSLIRRNGYRIVSNDIRKGRCPTCDTRIAGIFAEGQP